jgi:hypothetical protein
MWLPSEPEIRQIALDSVRSDRISGNGDISVQDTRLLELGARLLECAEVVDDDLWGIDPNVARCTQAAVVAASFAAEEAIMVGGDDGALVLHLVTDMCERNGLHFDPLKADFALRFLQPFLSRKEPPSWVIAEIRATFENSITEDPSDVDLDRADYGPPELRSYQAFVAPPMSSLDDEVITLVKSHSAQIEQLLTSNGFSQVSQPLIYTDPAEYPAAAYDAETVRRLDLRLILKSDLVVIVMLSSSPGLGTVAAWAGRTGAQVLLMVPADVELVSPLPASGHNTRIVRTGWPLEQEELVDYLKSIDASLESSRRKRESRIAFAWELQDLRDAALRLGADYVTMNLPEWLSCARVLEILRADDFYATATVEEIQAVRLVVGAQTAEPPPTQAEHSLSLADLRSADEFFESTRVPAELRLEVLKEHLATTGAGVARYDRVDRSHWKRLWQKVQSR